MVYVRRPWERQYRVRLMRHARGPTTQPPALRAGGARTGGARRPRVTVDGVLALRDGWRVWRTKAKTSGMHAVTNLQAGGSGVATGRPHFADQFWGISLIGGIVSQSP